MYRHHSDYANLSLVQGQRPRLQRRFSVGGWQLVKDANELTARKSYNGHTKSLGRGAVCLVRPCGTVEEKADGGAA